MINRFGRIETNLPKADEISQSNRIHLSVLLVAFLWIAGVPLFLVPKETDQWLTGPARIAASLNSIQ